MSLKNVSFRLFSRVKTDDSKMNIRQVGLVIKRPEDERGDSVNVLAFGGRLDSVTELLERHTDKPEASEAPAAA